MWLFVSYALPTKLLIRDESVALRSIGVLLLYLHCTLVWPSLTQRASCMTYFCPPTEFMNRRSAALNTVIYVFMQITPDTNTRNCLYVVVRFDNLIANAESTKKKLTAK